MDHVDQCKKDQVTCKECGKIVGVDKDGRKHKCSCK